MDILELQDFRKVTKTLITYLSLPHDQAELINSNLVRGSPSIATVTAVVSIDLGEVV